MGTNINVDGVISKEDAERFAKHIRDNYPSGHVMPNTVTGRSEYVPMPQSIPKRISIGARQQGKTMQIDHLMVGDAHIGRIDLQKLDMKAMEDKLIAALAAKHSDVNDMLSKGDFFHAMYGGAQHDARIDALAQGYRAMDALPKRGLNGPRDIPESWQRALKHIRRCFPHALLVGGALRDRDNGVGVKDLDIFIEASRDEIGAVEEAQDYIDKTLGWQTELVDTSVYAEWFGSTRILGILRAKRQSMPTIELIFCSFPSTPEEVFQRVDFGSSQIAFDGEVIYKTNNYESDYRMKRFRLVTEADDKQMVRRLERWARLREKYPKWSLDLGVMGQQGVMPWRSAEYGHKIIKMHGV